MARRIAAWIHEQKRELIRVLLLVLALVVMIFSLGEIERFTALYFGSMILSFALYFASLTMVSIDVLKDRLPLTYLADNYVLPMFTFAFLLFGWFRFPSGSFLLKGSILVIEIPLSFLMINMLWFFSLRTLKKRRITHRKGT